MTKRRKSTPWCKGWHSSEKFTKKKSKKRGLSMSRMSGKESSKSTRKDKKEIKSKGKRDIAKIRASSTSQLILSDAARF
jgi:hypothetical protein